MKKVIQAFGIIFLFIVSSISPIAFSINNITSSEIISESTSDGGLMDSAWPCFSHDIRHTGRSPYGKSGNWVKEKWNRGIGSMVFSSPAIDKNGTIYIGSNDRYFRAIYPNSTLKWKYKTGGGVSSSPAIAEDGTIYVGSEDAKLYAFYPNGTKKWSLTIGDGWVTSAPVIDEDGIIYVASVNGNNICAVYPNGTKKWSYKTGGMIYCSCVLDNNGTVYCGSYDTYLYAIYKDNGTLKWKYDTPNRVYELAIGNDGTIYFGNELYYLFAINPNGTKKWRKDIGHFIIASPAIAEDGTIYAVADDYSWIYRSHVYSINPDGTINWKYTHYDDCITTSPAIDKYGIIYVGTDDGLLLALNPDGTLRWSFKALEECFSSPAIGEDGTIYFGAETQTFDARLFAIEPFDDNAPDKPVINGTISGLINIEYNFTTITTDLDGDNVSYYFHWGDKSNSGWTDYVPSGTIVNLSHSWEKSGTYTVKVKAKDDYGMESEWGELTVTMPKDKTISNSPLLRFLERFPLLNRLLNLVT